jgi:hypothetical protein
VRLPRNQRSRRPFVIAVTATAATLAWAVSPATPARALEGWTAVTEVLAPGRAAQFDGAPDTGQLSDQSSGDLATDAVSTGSGATGATNSTTVPQVLKAPRPHQGKIILPVAGAPQPTRSPTVAAQPKISHAPVTAPASSTPAQTQAPTAEPTPQATTQPAATQVPSTESVTQQPTQAATAAAGTAAPTASAA